MSNPGVLRQQLQHVQLMLKGTTQRMEAEEASFRLMLDQHQHRVHCLSAEINNLQRQEAQLFAAVVSAQSAADPDSPAQVGAMSPHLQHTQQHAPGIPAQQQQPHPATAVQQQAQPQPGLPSAQPAPSSSLSHAAAAKEFVPRPVQLHEQQAHHSQPATSPQPAAAAAFSPPARSGAASALAGAAAGAPGFAPPPDFDPGQQDRAQQALPGLGPSQQDHALRPSTGRAAPPGFAQQPGFREQQQQQGAAHAAAEVAPKPADTSPLAAFPVPGQQHPRQQQASLQPPVMPLPEQPCAVAAAPAEGRAASDQPEWDVHASSCLLSDMLQSSAPRAETQPPPQGHQRQPNGPRQSSLSSSGGSEAADAAAAEGGPGPGSQPRGKEKGRGSGAYEDLLRGYVGGKRAQQSRQGGLPAEEGQETAMAVCGPQDFPSLGGASIGHSSSTTPAITAPAWANKWASGNLKAKLSAPGSGGSSTGTGGGDGSSGGWGAAAQPGEHHQQASIDLPGSAKRSVEEAEVEAGLRVPVDVTPDAARRRQVQKQVFEQVEVQLKQRRKVNVLEGLELHRGVLTPAEQARVVEAVEHWVALGRSGHLRGRTFSAPKKWLPGKGRVTMQMGCCYNYATDSEGRPPGILSSELVEPMPPLLQALCRRLTRWGVLPAAKEPNSAIVNVYEEGDCIPPHVDSRDFTRPFCTLSLVSEESIMFAQKLVPAGPGKFEARDGCGPALIPLPLGSCLVLKGYGGDQAMHCVPPVRSRRISITLRRMGHEHGEAVRREVQAYEQRYGRLRGFWEEERGVAAYNGRRRGSNSGGAITIK
ncbi:hypothetical protein D9Q98_003025 [Chlorella vulgaris]|uniref:Fe2OG dioxygenase domain-containing protein n=1 Tax=Chlorella vulgaris TaxID=3077 RepID=A0A9D4TUE5_CHLVU|nr:hypothetical protein D9Q98_003025 [Chlorella vulgaris]